MHVQQKSIRGIDGISYEVLSSKGNVYYTVEMFDGHAIGCECDAGRHNRLCHHQRAAGEAEKVGKEKKRRPLNCRYCGRPSAGSGVCGLCSWYGERVA